MTICSNRSLWRTFAAVMLAAFPGLVFAQVMGTPGTTITVNSAADGNVIVPPGGAPVCTLRNAIQAANTNLDVAGCKAGQQPKVISAQPLRVDFVDRIEFDIGKETPLIELRRALPFITEAVTIDGATHEARRVEISGARITSLATLPPPNGLVVLDSFTTLKSLVINGFRGAGILLTHVDEDEKPLLEPSIPEKLDETWSDPCASEESLLDPQGCRPDRPTDPDIPSFRAGGGTNSVIDCLIGTDAKGTVAVPNGEGIVVLSAGNTIGGMRRGMRNVISGNRGHGIVLESVNNRVFGNSIGVAVGNRLNGITVVGGQMQSASCDIRGNTIISNGANGVDAGFNFCWIMSNSIDNKQWSTDLIALQLFDSPTCDPSGFGEGAYHVASDAVPTNVPAASRVRFVVPALQRAGNHFFTATASTVEGGTSEFSPCLKH